jgi:hypothetical protein
MAAAPATAQRVLVAGAGSAAGAWRGRPGVEPIAGRIAELRPGDRLVLTDRGDALAYDALIVVAASAPARAAHGVVTCAGPGDAGAALRLLAQVARGARRGVGTRLVFLVPSGAGSPGAAIALALRAARHLDRWGVRERAALTMVTAAEELPSPELAPAGIAVVTGAVAREWGWGWLALAPAGAVAADRVVAVPALPAPAIPGLPGDALGLVPAGPGGGVAGAPGVVVVAEPGAVGYAVAAALSASSGAGSAGTGGCTSRTGQVAW